MWLVNRIQLNSQLKFKLGLQFRSITELEVNPQYRLYLISERSFLLYGVKETMGIHR